MNCVVFPKKFNGTEFKVKEIVRAITFKGEQTGMVQNNDKISVGKLKRWKRRGKPSKLKIMRDLSCHRKEL